MNDVTRMALGFLIGGLSGYMVGLTLGQATNARVSENIKTKVNNGVITVTVDAKTAAREGLVSVWEKLRG